MLRAILFDLDNTLVDRDAALRRWLDAVPGLTRPQAEVIARADRSGYGDRERFHRWLAARFPALGADVDEVRARFLVGVARSVQPDRAVQRLLDRLGARFALGLVSNGGRDTQREKLRRSGLCGRFAHVLISGELGIAKPAAPVFQRALSATGCAPDEALFVGDHPLQDIAGAARLGLQTCWISRDRRCPAGCPRPNFSVRQVTQLEEILPC